MISFDKIVIKLSQKSGSIILLEDIYEIIDPTHARPGAAPQVAKLVYKLVHSGHLTRIRNGVYLVGYDPLTQRMPQFITRRYWEIVTAFVRQQCWVGQAIISGLKSLELHMGNAAPVADLELFVPIGTFERPSKTLRISTDYIITLRSITVWAKSRTMAGWDLFPYLKSLSAYHGLSGATQSLRILSPESAILDTLLDIKNPWFLLAVNKFLDIWSKSLDREILGALVSRRYITSINRLREIAQTRGDRDLYEQCVSVIRDEGGGCFVTGDVTRHCE